MSRVRRAAVIAFLGTAGATVPAAAWAAAPTIDHDAVACIVVDRFPRLEARFDPAEQVSRGRLRFRPAGGTHWYSVAMKKESVAFVGVLPKPTPKLKSLDYYIEVTATDFATGRTREYAPEVVSGLGACQGDKVTAGSLGSASVVLEVPAGAPPVPAGFSSAGIVAMAAPAAATAAATRAGGGISAGVLIGVAAAGAAVAAVAATSAGGSNGPTASAAAPAPPTTVPAAAGLTGNWTGTAPDGFVILNALPAECIPLAADMFLTSFTQSGSTITGNVRQRVRTNLSPLCLQIGAELVGTLTGTVGSDTVSFRATLTHPAGTTVILDFQGAFTSNRMSGTFTGVSESTSGTWAVSRQ
jgi:hypothetical protein